MADEIAGRLFIELLPDVDRKKFQAAIDASVKGTSATVPTTLKLTKTAVADVKAEATKKLTATKPVSLDVKLTTSTGQVRKVVAETNKKLREAENKPAISVGLKTTAAEARRAVREANVTLRKAAKKPRLDVQLGLSVQEMELIRQLRVVQSEARVILNQDPIDLRIELDEKAQAALLSKIALLRERARLVAAAGEERSQLRLNEIEARGVQQRLNIQERLDSQRALIRERSENRIRRSSRETLRILRNDLSQFDSSTTRTLRRTGLVFAGFTAGVTASFAAISTAALVQFGKIEQAANKSASLFTAQRLGGAPETGKAFADRLLATNREITDQITAQARQVAVATKFDTGQIAEGFRFLAGAGVQLDASLQSIGTVAKLAQAGFLELEDTSDLVVQGFIAAGGDINKFGDEVGGLADKLVFVANESAVTLEEVLKAFSNRAGASFVAVGQSADEALNVIRLFGQTGIKGLKAGEQTAILIREITRSATLKAPEGWKQYGIELKNADGSARSFAAVLDELTRVASQQTKGFKDPAALVKLLNEELALTEKSSGGLRQLLPSIAELQRRGGGAADALAKLQTQSSGRLAAQTLAVTDNLYFQFETLGNNISNLASEFATGAGKSITDFLKEINGEAETGNALFNRLQTRAVDLGNSFSDFIGKALKGLSGPEGKRFFNGIIEGFRSTLRGVSGLFTAFRTEVFGPESRVGFFAVAGDAFAALGRFAERVLPRIGSLLGVVVAFVRNNKTSVELFVKAWLGLFAASKALRLFIIPLVGLESNLKQVFLWTKRVIGLDFAASFANAIPFLKSYRAQLAATTAATEALASAQAALAASQAAGATGFLAFSKKADVTAAAAAAAAQPTKLQATGKLAGNALLAGMMLPFKSPKLLFGGIFKSLGSFKNLGSVFGKLLLNIGRFAKFAGPIALIALAIEAAVGAVKGFFSELKRGSTGSGEFAKSLDEIKPVLEFLVNGFKDFVKVALDVLGIVFRLGASVGKFFAGAIRDAVVILGDFIRIFKELAQGNWGNAFKALGDVILNALLAPFKLLFAFIIDGIASILAGAKNIPVVGKYFDSWSTSLENTARKIRDWNVNLTGSKDAVERTKASVSSAKATVDGYSRAITVLGVQTILSTDRLTKFQARQKNVAAALSIVANRTKNAASYQVILGNASRIASNNMRLLAGGRKPLEKLFAAAAGGSKKATDRLIQFRVASIILARDKEIRRLSDPYLRLAGSIRIARIEQTRLNAARQIQNAPEQIAAEISAMQSAINAAMPDVGGGIGNDIGGGAADAIVEVKTAAEQATDAVNKLSQAQLNKQAGALVAKVTRNAAKGYKATAYEAEILRRTLPAVEAQLERQQAAVQKLDEALQNLQSTQLKGTKAFSDQAFAIEQNVKKLQLQRLDLIIAGTPQEDSAIKALDEQIAKLQQSSERLSLVESLKLDPLRRKLEETFNPVKELTFDEIIKQFNSIQKQRAPLTDAIAGGENLKATLETTIKDAEARFGEAGRQVTAGFALGIRGSTNQVAAAGRVTGNAALAGVNNVMKFGSPSRTMIQRGLWAVQGFVAGIIENRGLIVSAGATTMFGYLSGMRNVYENRVQPFIKGIAKWIKENKGPVSYDATLLRPAGEAMMKGFHRGLRDGFGEVKTWVSDVGPDLARHTIPDKIFKKMSAEFIIGNATADMQFDPAEFFASITPIGQVGVGVGMLGQSTGIEETIRQARIIAQMFGITANIDSARRRTGDAAYNAAIGGAAGSLHVAGRAMDFGGSDARLTEAADWARQYTDLVFQEVLWKTVGHYDHLHLGWKYGTERLIADIAGASRVVEEALANAANLTGMDFNLIAAIAKAESGFNPNVVSSAGAGGLMQLMPGTARSLGVTNVFDPTQNALGGAKYIKNMMQTFNNNMRLALAGYNAGPGNAAIALQSFGETIAYVDRVLRYFNQFSSGNYRAQGGKVNAMTPYIVGERGQELFIPAQNGSVISNKDLRDLIGALNGTQPGAAAGTTINDNRKFEVISNSTDPATVAALVDARMRSQVVGVRR